MKDTTKKGDRAIGYTLRVKQLTEAETMRQNRIFISYVKNMLCRLLFKNDINESA